MNNLLQKKIKTAMSKYQFSPNEAYAVYKVFDCKCQWCGEPLEFKNKHIDHLLPEILLEQHEKLKSILVSYGLDDSFDINDFENWIPLHPNCNTRKNDAVYSGLPIIKTLLDRCAFNKSQARIIKIKLEREPKKSEILLRIKTAIDKEVINQEDLYQLIREINIEELSNESDIEINKLITIGILKEIDKETWKVSKILNDDEVLVTNGGRTGIAPRSPTPHISWLCPNCLHFGPWDGNRCLICGHFSMPD